VDNGGARYAVKHNPWAYFVDERAACRRHDLPAARLAVAIRSGHLPDVGMVIPNLCNDAHDCDLSDADAWFRGVMRLVFAGPDWRSGRLAVVLTADEDEHDNQGNTVLTAVLHPSQQAHVVDTPLTHYSLSGLLSAVTGTEPLGEARTAPSMAEAFGLPLAQG
jgi:acid phosphatase